MPDTTPIVRVQLVTRGRFGSDDKWAVVTRASGKRYITWPNKERQGPEKFDRTEQDKGWSSTTYQAAPGSFGDDANPLTVEDDPLFVPPPNPVED